MSAPVDVLAVLEHYIGAFADHDDRYAQASELKKVRDAVAALIQTAALFEREVRRKYTDDTGIGHALLRSALARVGGA